MIKYVLIAVATLFIGYHSIEIKPLDVVKKAVNQKFDAVVFARTFLTKTLPPALEKAIPIQNLVSALAANKNKAFDELSHAVSIGNVRHFLVRGEGVVSKISEDEVEILVQNQNKNLNLRLATEFIYGNSIRDAAGLFDIKSFTNNMDVNNVAAEINKIIRTEVIPPFKQAVKVGNKVQFTGALEMNQEHPQLDNLEILPILLTHSANR
jgi:predicted lipoprotein